jgi:hypothetical protein
MNNIYSEGEQKKVHISSIKQTINAHTLITTIYDICKGFNQQKHILKYGNWPIGLDNQISQCAKSNVGQSFILN